MLMFTDTITRSLKRVGHFGCRILPAVCMAASIAGAAEQAEVPQQKNEDTGTVANLEKNKGTGTVTNLADGLKQEWSRVAELRRRYRVAELGRGNEGAVTNMESAGSLEQKWGIQVSGLFLSAGGNMVDFRYKVLDPAKAAILTKPEIKPELINQATGAKLIVPNAPKVGPLRQTVQKPVAGKMYFMLFANTRHHVKSGDKVTITAGDFKIENLIVE
jgi:hypothetical protein